MIFPAQMENIAIIIIHIVKKCNHHRGVRTGMRCVCKKIQFFDTLRKDCADYIKKTCQKCASFRTGEPPGEDGDGNRQKPFLLSGMTCACLYKKIGIQEKVNFVKTFFYVHFVQKTSPSPNDFY